jgi:nucleotide-binding universal stress UspA family protein
MSAVAGDEPRPKLDELRLHRLLVAIDGSGNAELALRAAVTAARRDHAAITLISVSPDIMSDSRFAFAVVDPTTIQRDADEGANRILRDAVDRLPDDMPVTTLFRRGKAGPEIVAAAGEQPYDAIILGARGLGRVHALMGSVSQYVMHHAKASVFVAHAPSAC